ncbi:hypothetical protein WMY93_008931 [Mugilogobius chulae]|uniref:Myb-like domain-containing protein n=1 Tax=Mugilogobius chulae TaxID=88201 RepID=A0AAW0PGI6_9GOBI
MCNLEETFRACDALWLSDMDSWMATWSVQETDCLMKICADAELHQRLDSPCTSKDIIEDIQKEMSAQGYDVTSEEILDKLRTLKNEYGTRKNNTDQEMGNCLWTKIDMKVVDFILGDKEDDFPQTTEMVKTEPTEDASPMNVSTNTGQRINSEKWIDAEVQGLLSVYAAKKMQQDTEGHKKTHKVFDGISKDLASFGIYHTPKQCREKVKKLKQDYKKIKDYNNQSGAEIKTGKWYDILDSILGHEPLYSGIAVTISDSAEESREGPESICTENNVDSRGSLDGQHVLEAGLEPDRKAVLQMSIDAALCSSDLKIVHVVSDTPECSSYPSLPLPRPLLKMNNDKWIDAEVQALLSVYATTKMQEDMEGQKKNNKIFDRISKELEIFGVHHTPKQCREKVKKLKQDYKKIKDYNNQSGAEIKTGKWYDTLDSILEEVMKSTEANTLSGEGPASICTENIESSEESAPEPEKRSSQFPFAEQRRVVSRNPFRPAVRSMTFRSRPVKRKRKESSELLECLERMQERYLEHSREMHEALLNNIDTHMTAVVGLMERMASAMEAQVAKRAPPQ